jgi:RNA polymerase sigma factor (sigma-70 family)
VDAAYADIGERLEAGEPEALEDCYRTLGPLVMSYLTRYVQQADIQDVMQRVFYEVWRSHDRYDPSLSLRAWVLGIARKRAIDHLRKRRDTVVSLDSVREITGEDGRDIADRLAWPTRCAKRSEGCPTCSARSSRWRTSTATCKAR